MNNQINNGIDAAASIDASETYFVNPTTARKITPAHKTASGTSARKTPTPVATPLPPRNPSQIGKMWPKSTAIVAAANSQPAVVGSTPFNKLFATRTAM